MRRLIVLLAALASLPAWSAVEVFATVPEWGALAREIGGERVAVFVATNALQDTHRIEARPSLLARARRAQLVVATGAELETGWLPVVLRESGNAAVQPGRDGYFEAAALVERLEVPAALDRANGDVHAAGNPHVHLDPHRLLRIGEALAERLARVDPANAAAYRAGFADFAGRWRSAIGRWEKAAAPLRGVPVLVHHGSFAYLTHWLGMPEIGTLEPKPGVEPSSGQLATLLERQRARPARLVLRAAYQPAAASDWFASRAAIPAVVLPYTVGGSPAAQDLFGLFDDSIARLLQGLR